MIHQYKTSQNGEDHSNLMISGDLNPDEDLVQIDKKHIHRKDTDKMSKET